MATHSTLREFNPTREDWTSYAERLELYFTANDIVTEKKQQSILLSVCGAETYRLIRNPVASTKPTEIFFAELVNIVKHHHQPLPRLLSFKSFTLTLIYRKRKKLYQSLWLAYAGYQNNAKFVVQRNINL